MFPSRSPKPILRTIMYSMIFLRRAYIPVSAVACGLLLLAGCSKDSGNETISNDTDRQQIAPSITLKSPEDPSAPSGSMSNVYLLQMNFGFARNEEVGRNEWAVDENKFNATCTEYVPGTSETEAVLSFDPVQYYYPDDRTSQMQGWYPSTGVYVVEDNAGYVDFIFDGQDDILISDIGEGNTFNKGLNRLYHFYHVLTQIQFEVKAVSDIAATQWGKITGITIIEESSNTYSHDLFTASTVFQGDGSTNISQDNIGDGGFSLDRNSPTDFNVSLPAEGVTVTSTDYSPAGLVMIEPRDVSSRSGKLHIIISSENSDGVKRESEFEIKRDTYSELGLSVTDFVAGYAYTFRLELQQDDVVFTLVPAEWKSVKQEVEVGENHPYVRGSDNYIISRNMFGDATGWTVRDGDWSAEENNVPAILEVATTDEQQGVDWDTAKCPDGWHLPTEQELKLIWTCQSQLSKEGHQQLAGEYWSCTKETEGHFYYVDMDAKSYPNPATGAAETETKNVRCVRDIKMSID